MMKKKISELIREAIEGLQKNKTFPVFEMPKITVEYPGNKDNGDYSSNVSLQLSKIIKRNPLELARELSRAIFELPEARSVFKIITGEAPGFINFFVSDDYLRESLKEILKQKDGFGKSGLGGGKKINVEFISANPTGPLTLGNGRGGFCGDVLASVLERAGYEITREYYINDQGEQIIKLGHSVLKDPEAVYQGDYIEGLHKRIKGVETKEVGEKAARIIFDEMIKPTVKRMGINFDIWFSEKSLYEKKEVDQVIDDLTKKGFTYKSEGAVWFKSKELDDDKDRVLIRTDGIRTYFASDIAYLKNKIERGFEKNVLFLGADHYGYVARLKAAAEALGYGKDQIEPIVMQMVRLLKDGQEVRMSKRTGVYVTLDELLDEIGLDVARFFFLQRSANTHLNFDLSLAKEQSVKNPVYYVQYAHARICSILRKANVFLLFKKPDLKLLKEQQELDLIRQLIKLPEIIEDISEDFQVQQLPQYAVDLADSFHRFYEKCLVISDNRNLSRARLSLIIGARIVFRNTLGLMGISSPKKM